MNTNRIQLQVKDILNKSFKKQLFGFNQEQVDQFLDTIMQDYLAYEQEIKELNEELNRFKENKEEEQEHYRKNAIDEQQTKRQVVPYQVNYDILKRVSNLEKAVFGKKDKEDI